MLIEEKESNQPTDQEKSQASEQDSTGEKDTSASDDDTSQENQQEQSAPDSEKVLDIKNLPKELEPFKQELLKSYYAKTRELAEGRREVATTKKDAETLQQLMNYKPFQEWYSNEKNKQSGQVSTQEFTEEQLEEIRSSPKKFKEFLQGIAEQVISSKYEPIIQDFKAKSEDIEIAQEYNDTVKKYGEDFANLHESGELDKFYDKGLDMETAYEKHQFLNNKGIDSEVIKKSKKASSEKPSSGEGGLPNIKVIKASKNFSDTFDEAFTAVMKGEKFKIKKGE